MEIPFFKDIFYVYNSPILPLPNIRKVDTIMYTFLIEKMSVNSKLREKEW
jgi:hypothetical protein